MGDEAPASAPTRHKGVVKWFNATKGFGFVTPADSGEDLFVHQTSIQAEGFRSLREGEEVEYDVEEGNDGRTKAVKVTGPEGAAPQGAPRRSSYRSAAAGSAVGAATVGAYRGNGRGRAAPMPMAYGYGYGAYDYYGGYGAYPAYGYPPRAMYGMRGVGGRGRAGRFPGRAGGRAGYMQGMPGGQAGESSGLQVVVHNLPWTTTWQQLKDTFKEWKVERADVVYDSWGKSRGFGTVRFSSKEDAESACTKLNNTEYEGRTITVRLDRFA
eukprot:GHRQ01001017.1.p1 GENE.GHRQ01001017.1~~GHRQ01001017.1.p1  ORF type:complete len:269 (+),score=83.22 GHRQ01001017.1:156-962(+)